MELNKINGNSYWIKAGTNIGVFTFKNKNCLLIDTGINNTSARKKDEVLKASNLHPKYIINTHSHLDHCGGNNYFTENYPGCVTYTSLKESLFMENQELRPYTLFNSKAPNSVKSSNKPINVDNILEYGVNKINDEKIEIISLKGHSIEQIGVVTPDKVCYLGDGIFSEDIINKYSLPYLYDIDNSISTLNSIKDIEADFFIVSHGEGLYNREEIIALADKNICNIEKYCEQLIELAEQPSTKEDLLQNICILNDLSMDFNQYYINQAALSAFIAYLVNKNILEHSVENEKLYYYRKS